MRYEVQVIVEYANHLRAWIVHGGQGWVLRRWTQDP